MRQQHVFTESHGCECGSIFIGSSNDARQIRNLLEAWRRIHPKDRDFNGMHHDEVTVDRARELRAKRGHTADRNRVEVR